MSVAREAGAWLLSAVLLVGGFALASVWPIAFIAACLALAVAVGVFARDPELVSDERDEPAPGDRALACSHVDPQRLDGVEVLFLGEGFKAKWCYLCRPCFFDGYRSMADRDFVVPEVSA